MKWVWVLGSGVVFENIPKDWAADMLLEIRVWQFPLILFTNSSNIVFGLSRLDEPSNAEEREVNLASPSCTN